MNSKLKNSLLRHEKWQNIVCRKIHFGIEFFSFTLEFCNVHKLILIETLIIYFHVEP